MKKLTSLLLVGILTAPAFAQDAAREVEGTNAECTDPSGRCHTQQFDDPATAIPRKDHDKIYKNATGTSAQTPATGTTTTPGRNGGTSK